MIGSVLPMIELTLEKNEEVFAQPGAMQWMEDGIEMKTNMKDGLMGGLKRSLTGEKAFVVNFKSNKPESKVAFGHSYPGKILEINVADMPVICQKRAFLMATLDVDYNMHIQKKLGTGIFGGEGFIMQKLSGTGRAWVEMDGEYLIKELSAGEKITMETGALGMYEVGMELKIERVKGFKNILFGGEGLFLTTITGPGKVWIQTAPVQSLAAELIPFIGTNKN